MLDWSVVTAISSAVSAAVVLGGGAVAVYQLREARRAAQFDATQRMVTQMLDPDFNRALRFVIGDLAGRMTDPQYRGRARTIPRMGNGCDATPRANRAGET